MWPRRMDIQTFRTSGFVEGCAPNLSTLKTRIKKGDIPGEVQGNRYYVWVGPNNELMKPAQNSGNQMADALMDEWSEEHGTAA